MKYLQREFFLMDKNEDFVLRHLNRRIKCVLAAPVDEQNGAIAAFEA